MRSTCHKPKHIRLIFLAIASLIVGTHLTGCANNNVKRTLSGTKQDVSQFVDPTTANQPLLSHASQNQRIANYLAHYFSPWTNSNRMYSNEYIFAQEIGFLADYKKAPGWDENYQALTSNWLDTITKNMSLANYPNSQQPAITLGNVSLRVFPTDNPSYTSLTQAGKWYPFDNLQVTTVAVNTPVLILQKSQDGAWDLVLTHNAFGWVHSQLVANVNSAFEQQWQKQTFVAVVRDNTPVYSSNKIYRFTANIGAIFPQQNQSILLAVADDQQNAVIKEANVPDSAVPMPIILTTKNITLIANQLLGGPYGWGGLYGYRDCSSTLADLFTPFALWLPRNSTEQLQQGKVISLAGLRESRKEQLIINNGKPFLTLIGLPGHVMLYIGQLNNRAYVFHDVWALHTRNAMFQEGRAVIGKTVVTPLDLGHYDINVPRSFLNKSTTMAVL